MIIMWLTDAQPLVMDSGGEGVTPAADYLASWTCPTPQRRAISQGMQIHCHSNWILTRGKPGGLWGKNGGVTPVSQRQREWPLRLWIIRVPALLRRCREWRTDLQFRSLVIKRDNNETSPHCLRIKGDRVYKRWESCPAHGKGSIRNVIYCYSCKYCFCNSHNTARLTFCLRFWYKKLEGKNSKMLKMEWTWGIRVF